MINYYTAEEIQQIYHRPIGTIRRLASTEPWRKVGDRKRPALYHADDVKVTMERLASQAA